MPLLRGLSAVAVALLLATSCGFRQSSGESGVTVTVVDGIDKAPAELAASTRPIARYVADAGKVIFVSAPLYSSSCPPRGSATQDGGTVTLTIDHGNDGNCTADAGRDTFLIESVQGVPKHLLVVEEGQDDQRLDLSD